MSAGRAVVLRAGAVSLRVPRRSLLTVLVGVPLVLLVVAVGCSLGSYAVGPGELLEVLTGGGERAASTVVLEWRAPRAVASAVLGAALALSGAVFQSLTRNPLGSPDVVGFSTGSFTGVLVAILLGGTGFAAFAAGALAGGLLTTAAVYLLAFRRGVQGFRLIIVGIAVSAVLSSFNTWATVKGELDLALRAAVWGAGTLNGLRWPQVLPGLVAVLVLAVLLGVVATGLRTLELGDETAVALGARVERAKAVLVVLAVGLLAVVTAVAGPIAFVALVAPQVARRLTRAGSVELAPSAVVGAVLLSVSDLVAQHAFGDTAVPVGAITVCLGGAYLIWLITREAGRR